MATAGSLQQMASLFQPRKKASPLGSIQPPAQFEASVPSTPTADPVGQITSMLTKGKSFDGITGIIKMLGGLFGAKPEETAATTAPTQQFLTSLSRSAQIDGVAGALFDGHQEEGANGGNAIRPLRTQSSDLLAAAKPSLRRAVLGIYRACRLGVRASQRSQRGKFATSTSQFPFPHVVGVSGKRKCGSWRSIDVLEASLDYCGSLMGDKSCFVLFSVAHLFA